MAKTKVRQVNVRLSETMVCFLDDAQARFSVSKTELIEMGIEMAYKDLNDKYESTRERFLRAKEPFSEAF
jgi:hypothetical protein